MSGVTRVKWRPDWRKPEQYLTVEKTSPTQWAWEFLRRNPQYEDFWYSYIRPQVGSDFDFDKQLFPFDAVSNISSESSRSESSFREVFVEKFGLLHPTPPFADHPQILGFDSSVIGHSTAGLTISTTLPVSISIEKTFISIRLDWPLAPQLKAAKKELTAAMKKLKEAGLIKPQKSIRLRRTLYKEYWRILDAFDAGVPAKEIAKILFPKLSDENDNYAGRARVRDYRRAALLLRNSGYRFIPMNA